MRLSDRMGRATAWAGLAVGVALLIAAAGLLPTDGVEEFGDATAAAAPGPGAGPRAGPTHSAAPSERLPGQGAARQALGPHSTAEAEAPDPAIAPPVIGTRPARLADLDAVPAALAIERFGITAPVDPVGVGSDGALEIPSDIERAGWFRHGPLPGQATGSTVIAAHVDGGDGPGVFFELRNLREGDAVTVESTAGRRTTYEVTALARYDKDDLPISDLFAEGGPHRLVLITCGGAFDEATRTYAENVVVTAQPARDEPAEG